MINWKNLIIVVGVGGAIGLGMSSCGIGIMPVIVVCGVWGLMAEEVGFGILIREK